MADTERTDPQGQSRDDLDLAGMDLEAGLEAAFDATEDGDAPSTCHSVLAQLAGDGQELLPVLLKDPDSEEDYSPVVRPGAGGVPTGRGSRYQLVGEIARGGVGIVLKGHDVDLGRDVAMKVIREEHRDNPDVVQRFVEEAQIGSQLQHPGVVPVYEIGLGKDKRPYFTMKLVKGKTLSALLSKRTSPARDRRRFISLFESVCQTVGYAHARGVIHRDLKPSNVMVGAFGEVLVVDWGMGKVLKSGGVDDERTAMQQADQTIVTTHRSGSEGSHSLVGSVIGTPRYMAPEQARGDLARVDERTDVFGLGGILCEILTGKPPYAGEDREIIRMAANAKLDDAEERLKRCGADPELIEIARGCLAPAPEGRPQNAGEVAEQIGDYLSAAEERVQESKLAAVRAEERAEAAHAVAKEEQHAAAHARRARRLTLALATVAVLAVLGGAAFWLNRQNERAAAEAATADGVTRALERADLFAEQAEATQELETWDLALAAAEEAGRLLDSGSGGDALRERVEATLAQLEPRAAAARDVRERMARAKALIHAEDIEGALSEYEAVVALMPKYAECHRQMAVLYKSEDLVGDAIQAFRRAVARKATSESMLGLARALEDGGDGAAGLQIVRDAVERFPGDPRVHNMLANFLPAEDWPGRIAAYRASLRVDPSYGPPAFNLKKLYKRLVDAGVARVLEGDLLPPDGRWRRYLAGVCFNSQRFPDALRLYELAFEANPHLEENLVFGTNHRLFAARTALQVAQDKGHDEDERRALRAKAYAWIEAHFEAWAERSEEADAAELTNIVRGLARWRTLPGVVLRNAQALGVEEAEREILGGCQRTADEAYLAASAALAVKGDPEALLRTLKPVALVRMAGAFLSAGAPPTALHFFEAAFEQQSTLEGGTTAPYNAACAALLVAAEEDTEPARALALRGKALAWLQMCLHAYDDAFETGDPASIRKQIAWWLEDPDLASVRGDAIDGLPTDEQADWTKLWAQIERIVR